MLTGPDITEAAMDPSKKFDDPCLLYLGISQQATTNLGKYIFKVGISSNLEVRTGSMNGLTFEKIPLLGAADLELRPIKKIMDRIKTRDIEGSFFTEFDRFKEYLIIMQASPALQGGGKTEIYRINPESLSRFIKSHLARVRRRFVFGV